MRCFVYLWPFVAFLFAACPCLAQKAATSDGTRTCIDCHAITHPGIVEDWRQSRHAQVLVGDAFNVRGIARKVTAASVPDELSAYVVGCAECHTVNSTAHTDNFEHNGYDVHMVVTPKDCAVCHSLEAEEYSENLMSHARKNLAGNPLYQQLENSIIAVPTYHSKKGITYEPADENTKAEACYYCHGTQLEVAGFETRETMTGEMTFPIIRGWPNQGVGRVNPDGSKGSCSACHTRHGFSIEMARKPYTCAECHTGPDVPAYKVYSASKHGNIQSSKNNDWNYKAVPWSIGKDFTAPTCAACHISLVTNPDGEVISKRTHRMNDRLPWRLFGVLYAHPHPLSPDLTVIRNKDGQPLPSAFDGTFSTEYLIDSTQQEVRKKNMQALCLNCHATSWVDGQWERLENSIRKTNTATHAATSLMVDIWDSGFAGGLKQNENPFDETIEKEWSRIWLFYANAIRFSSAMGGGGDHSVFEKGAFNLSEALQKMETWYALQKKFETDKSE